jgi:hypothetical protein
MPEKPDFSLDNDYVIYIYCFRYGEAENQSLYRPQTL